ncbi:MAG TPA: trigger factor [Candidatus Babeliales bacterium]|nr:trigger factor [Candidatus Babeliales bacterium]
MPTKHTNSARDSLRLSIECQPQSTLGKAHIVVPASVVDIIYKEAAQSQKHKANPSGFNEDTIPFEYIDQHYKTQIVEHLKEFILKYLVISFLYQEMRSQKIITVGDPRLQNISLQIGQDAHYTFEYTPVHITTSVRDWKYLPYKPPVRKKYKDIDKQAELFLAKEVENEKKHLDSQKITIGDWVSFDVILCDKNNKPLFDDSLKENLWVHISDEDTNFAYQELFIDKKKGDFFLTTDECLQEYFSSQFDTHYQFGVQIVDILSQSYLSVLSFKEHFKLKSNRKVHQKFVEVFSFRNDISLRRSMVEEALKLLIKTYPHEIPSSAIFRQQKQLLEHIQQNPDYMVYKKEPDFLEKISSLAKKQIAEVIMIDRFAYQENIQVSKDEVCNYLNLTKRNRTKEFIYFQHRSLRAQGTDYPISRESLKQACLREKTLNHILYRLNKL